MATCFLIRDIHNKPAANTQLVAQFDGKQYAVHSGPDGIARFDVDIPSYARLITVGYATATKVPCTPAGGGGSAGPGERELEKVGTQCSIIERSTSFGTNFVLKHDSGQLLTGGYEDLSRLRERLNPSNYPQCYAPLETKATTMLDDIGAKIDAIYDKFAGLEDWLIDRILRIILAAMDREVEKRGR